MLTFNNIMRMVAGKRYFGVEGAEDDEEAREFRELLKEVFKYGGVANPGDFLPLLRWIDYMDFEKNLSRIMTKLDAFLQRLIEEHRSKNGGNTMIDHMLSLQESEPQNYTHSVIKSTMLVTSLFQINVARKIMNFHKNLTFPITFKNGLKNHQFFESCEFSTLKFPA